MWNTDTNLLLDKLRNKWHDAIEADDAKAAAIWYQAYDMVYRHFFTPAPFDEWSKQMVREDVLAALHGAWSEDKIIEALKGITS